MKIEFFLPFPPSINNYYSKTRNGVYISKKGSAFASSGIQSILEQLGPVDSIESKINLVIVLYPPDKRIRDLDNYVKPLQDTITKSGLWLDDGLIDQLAVYRGEQVKSGSCFVRISDAAPILHNTTKHRALI
jgi:crossover junction endodeoxyribonuclease RusA